MGLLNTIVFSVVAFSANTESAECELGWVRYKNDLCLKTFNSYVSYEGAKNICNSEENQVSRASLVMVKESEMQVFLDNYTQDMNDYVWLGGKSTVGTGEFRWIDGEPISYTNWQDGYPRNITTSDACIELRPVNARSSPTSDGKWADVNCQKRNMVMCQRKIPWTLPDAVDEIIRIRKLLLDTIADHDVTKETLQATQQTLQATQENIAAVSSRVVPVGSVYIEYNGQSNPRTLWPSLAWQDITSSYAGMFFRAFGEGSAEWGSIQEQCSPRITQLQRGHKRNENPFPHAVTVPSSG